MNSREKEDLDSKLQAYIGEQLEEGRGFGDIFNELIESGDVDRMLAEWDEKEVSVQEEARYKFDLARSAVSEAEAKKLVQEAVRLDPDFIEAQIFAATLEGRIKNVIAKLQKIIAKEQKTLEKEGIWATAVGDFWAVWETRPYMRAVYALFETYRSNQMYRKALEIGYEMICLNENDNLGLRHELAAIHATIEDEEHLLTLLDRFAYDKNIRFMLPHIVLLVKTGREDEALAIYEMLQRNFPGFNAFLKKDPASLLREMDDYDMAGYQVGSAEEFIVACCDLGREVFMHTRYLYEWLYEHKDAAKKKTKKAVSKPRK